MPFTTKDCSDGMVAGWPGMLGKDMHGGGHAWGGHAWRRHTWMPPSCKAPPRMVPCMPPRIPMHAVCPMHSVCLTHTCVPHAFRVPHAYLCAPCMPCAPMHAVWPHPRRRPCAWGVELACHQELLVGLQVATSRAISRACLGHITSMPVPYHEHARPSPCTLPMPRMPVHAPACPCIPLSEAFFCLRSCCCTSTSSGLGLGLGSGSGLGLGLGKESGLD